MKILKAGLKQYIDKEPPFVMFWKITYLCNYDCHYCYLKPDKHNDSGYLDIRAMYRIVDKISMIPRDMTLIVEGGEPTLHDDYTSLIQKILSDTRNIKEVLTITNGCRPLPYFMSLVGKITDTSRVAFDFSCHLEYLNAEKILENVQYLRNCEIKTGLRLMADPLKFDLFKKTHEFFSNSDLENIVYKVRPIMNTVYESEYERYLSDNCSGQEHEDELFYFQYEDGSEKLATKNELRLDGTNFKGMKCLARNHWEITPMGRLRLTCGHPDNLSGKYVMIQSTVDKLIENIDRPIICKKEVCECYDTMILPKYI